MYSTHSRQNNETLIITDLKNIFQNAINSVLPSKLISENVSINENKLTICQKVYNNNTISTGCHVIGFGKAVLSMAMELEKILGTYIKGGILSVPSGILKTLNQFELTHVQNSKLIILEGAKNNLPDQQAENNTRRIIEYISNNVNCHEYLIILISGGGSALLTLPKAPLTLNQKTNIIKLLASSGADIKEINSVRKHLSLVKGGGLAQITYPHTTISLILSDIIDDPIDLIASGPTVVNSTCTAYLKQIFDKYNLNCTIPNEIGENIFKQSELNLNIPIKDGQFCHVDNFLIGNNKKALNSAATIANNLGYLTCVMSAKVEGEVQNVSLYYVQLVNIITEYFNTPRSKELFTNEIQEIAKQLQLTNDIIDKLYDTIINYKANVTKLKGLCLIMGGETTVLIRGSGTGGRNQQLALHFSIDIENQLKYRDAFIVYLLCGGTDGIDGPTDAAGAISFSKQCARAKQMNLDANNFCENNNSYEYYTRLMDGKYLIKIGHTGTNVMDIHILTISLSSI